MTQNTTPQFSPEQLIALISEHYAISGTLKALPSYCDLNFLLTTPDDRRFIVKVANSAEPLLELEMQTAAMAHLGARELPVPQVISNLAGDALTPISDGGGQDFQLRLLSYLEGRFYADAASSSHGSALWRDLGDFIGRISQALADFDHPGAHRYLEWDLHHGDQVVTRKKQLLDDDQQQLVNHFVDLYRTRVKPVIGQLPTGVLHNDANDYNLLIDEVDRPEKITGLIDFGDMVYSQRINELAITCAYALLSQADPLAVVCQVASSYNERRELTDHELTALLPLIALRLCTSVCNSAEAIRRQPDNDYLLVSAKPAWQALGQLRQWDPVDAERQLRQACDRQSPSRSKQQIIDFRQRHLGKSLSLSYREPLKIVRGRGAWLYDEQGRGYLDMVNNVCHVGHCHPRVVAAGQQQMARLNTNTRYLHDNLVNYADRLLATFPDPLSVCFFVNSGSEANELAMRLARTYTGSKELLVVDGAYHGNTSACIDASPYKFDGPGGQGAPDHVHKVMLPDPYRGAYPGGDAASGEAYARDVGVAIERLRQQGKAPGAFICESLQGVAGQIIMPDGYLAAVYPQVRAAGGVCIADEVQVGFGRVGSHMWAFETQQVVPDIVTLGKPIGNGHPMAAVVTTAAIADAFVTGMEYFNTFGGNPVSCAIGLAVLETIEQEGLRQNALETGHYLREQLGQLQQQFPLIGDVRGLGLFVGVELVLDRSKKTPATEQTAWLIEFMKAEGILLSSEGPFYNILKIKPPIVFGPAEADRFLDTLRRGLEQLPR